MEEKWARFKVWEKRRDLENEAIATNLIYANLGPFQTPSFCPPFRLLEMGEPF